MANNFFNKDEKDMFIKIANSKNLRYNNNPNTYFQIYPKSVPESEGSSGIHYEFWRKKYEKFNLSIHVEQRAKNYKKLRVDIFNQKESTRNVLERQIIDFSYENIEKIFNEIYDEYEEKINNFYLNRSSEQNIDEEEDKMNLMSLNKILYGPPGTGKTYNTIDKALQIIDGTIPDNREEAKERFEVLKDAGQIEFVTFHQSYGYEEFVEGIKANTTDNGIEYNIEPGIFKVLCEKSNSKNIFILGTKIGKYTIVGINNVLLKLERENKAIIPIPMYLLREVLELIDKKIITPTDLNNKTAIDKMSQTTEKYIINGYPNIFRDLAEYYLDHKNISNNDNKYILIIDEINRGNISKIFGELITLIEESKRLGNDEAMEVTLPYSGDKFGVPKNLY
ncbi:MAG: hypothetical protein KAH72_05240, partial [Flavobacteriaceae bacterium]|nr:hypothetical protein [Flavobacteriaceae bacterium]